MALAQAVEARFGWVALPPTVEAYLHRYPNTEPRWSSASASRFDAASTRQGGNASCQWTLHFARGEHEDSRKLLAVRCVRTKKVFGVRDIHEWSYLRNKGV
jgi:hypothetical protein